MTSIPPRPVEPEDRKGLEGGVRAKAYAAASELIAEQGVERMSIRTIAARAGIGVSSMYHHFPTKEALLLQIALNGFEKLTEGIQASTERYGPDVGPFSSAARAFLGHVARQPTLHDLMFDQHLMARHDSLRAAERAAFQAFTSQVAADPRFPAHLAQSMAVTFWALGRGIAVTALSQPERTLSAEFGTHLASALGHLIDRNVERE